MPPDNVFLLMELMTDYKQNKDPRVTPRLKIRHARNSLALLSPSTMNTRKRDSANFFNASQDPVRGFFIKPQSQG